MEDRGGCVVASAADCFIGGKAVAGRVAGYQRSGRTAVVSRDRGSYTWRRPDS